MRYHWLRKHAVKNNLRIFWALGVKNLSDYYTKCHPTKYNEKMSPLLYQMYHLIFLWNDFENFQNGQCILFFWVLTISYGMTVYMNIIYGMISDGKIFDTYI